jgi:hypothetical protein
MQKEASQGMDAKEHEGISQGDQEVRASPRYSDAFVRQLRR